MTATGIDLRADTSVKPTGGKLVPPSFKDATVVDLVAAPLFGGPGRGWLIGFLVASIGTLVIAASAIWLLEEGIGIWGLNTSVVWGVAIASYVWWIGIGNAGTLISAMLLIMRQPWRASMNRFAEAMTIFAVSIAGIFPILHLGRPMYFYWLAPYPNTMTLWPQWRSALVWDFWAILSYLLFSIMFWYTGMIPDLAALRDRAKTRPTKLFYGCLALGWRGSARHWTAYRMLTVTMAALAIPLVCSVHSIVGLDFAASLMPGWQEPIFPPYFVLGAMYSGFAMVIVLAALVRWGYGLQAVVTVKHFDIMAQIQAASALIMGISYATEWFAAWYNGRPDDRSYIVFLFTGHYAPIFFAMLICNVVLAQIFWFPAARQNILLICIVSIFVNIGMWLERILIIWVTLSHTHLPSMERVFIMKPADWIFIFFPLAFFALLFLIFAKFLPTVAIHEVQELRRKEAEA
ncbi:MAG: NrfD/PsrC family molybdoenzyme membrane anchor subunit [Rhodomicrobium sp.]